MKSILVKQSEKNSYKKKVHITTLSNSNMMINSQRIKSRSAFNNIASPLSSRKKVLSLNTNHTSKSSSKNIRKKYSFIPHIKRMHNLNKDIIDSLLTTKGYDNYCNGYYSSTEFSSSCNNIHSKRNSNTEEDSLRNIKKNTVNSPLTERALSQRSLLTHRSTESSTSQYKRRPLNSNKLLMANIGRTKRNSIIQLNPQQQDSDSISPFLPKTSIKRASLVDRFLFKIVNPDGVIEDYITEGDRPGDKYKRLKNQLIKGKNKVYKLVQDIKKTQILAETMLNVYVTKIKARKYTQS